MRLALAATPLARTLGAGGEAAVHSAPGEATGGPVAAAPVAGETAATAPQPANLRVVGSGWCALRALR